MLANTVVGTLVVEAVVTSVATGKMAQSGVFRALRKDFANLPGKISTRCSTRSSPPRPRPKEIKIETSSMRS